MIRFFCNVAIVLLFCVTTATPTTFIFGNDPFAGSDAPTTPGRQIVGNERFITFNPATDIFSLDPSPFGITQDLSFLSALSADVPASGVNLIVLQDSTVPFAAGIAANLIAEKVTDPGPGFFVYFNSGLDLPRLVFSSDLSDNTADLKIVARMTNLTGPAGRDQLATFSEANFVFAPVPEPSTIMTTAAGFLTACAFALRRRRKP